MLSDEVLDKVIEVVTNRVEQTNTYVLEQIGKSIKEIGKLTPSKAQQLVQILRYGGDYDKIVKKIAEVTQLNVKDIYKIFEEVAKRDYNFAEKFYKYRNKKFIPYEENIALQRQVNAISNLMIDNYLSKTKAIGFSVKDNKGNILFKGLKKTYQDAMDRAILSISQGKSSFQDEMYKTIKELASSGLKTIDYASGRSMRLDSAVRMQMKDALRNLHNEMQQIIGGEIDADGIEISTHSYPADDHAEVQGRQFRLDEYEKLNNGLEAKDYKENTYTLDHDGKNGYRPISTMNCYHYVFSIVLGVSEPEYTDKQLKQIIQDNNKGFKIDGEKYTLYQGTQLQRQLELEIRKQKDTQIMAKASYNSAKPEEQGRIRDLIDESQRKITILTTKYRELSKKSGLLTKMDRMRVPNYKRINVKNLQ